MGGQKLGLLCETQQISILMSTTYLLGDFHIWEGGKLNHSIHLSTKQDL